MADRATHSQEALDRAVKARLGRLAAMPVDASRLDRMLEGKLPARPVSRWKAWVRPMRLAVAASLLVVGVLGVLLMMTATQPVQASPAMMAQFHRDLVSQRVPAMEVGSIEEAARMLRSEEGLPYAPDAHVMACCMREVENRKMACVLLRTDGVPVTMTVADASEVRAPQAATREHGGESYHVEQVDELTMVTTQRQGRWVCLIAELPAERLMELAGQLR